MWADVTIWDIAAISTKLIVYLGSFLAMGSVIFALANPALDQALIQPLKRTTIIAAVFAVCGSMAQFFVQCGRLMDEGLTGIIDPEMIELVAGAPLGEAVAWRIFGLILLLAFVGPVAFAKVAAAIGAVITAMSFSLVGHGSDEPRWLIGTLVSVHVLAAAFWIGALLPLYLSANKSFEPEIAGRLAHRFGQHAAFVVGVLIAMGVFLAWWLIETPYNLIRSEYGFTLLTKLIFVAGLLGLAAGNKLYFVPKMIGGSVIAAMHLRRSIALEATAIVTILMITAVLTTIVSPPNMEGSMEKSETMEGMDHGN